jgi:hypothetical protein
LGERRFCKPEVVGSIPISSTNLASSDQRAVIGKKIIAHWSLRPVVSRIVGS